MKKNLLFVILFFIISCQKNNVDFKQFEISHTDGWKRSYSFVVFKDRFFEFNENSGERKGGKLNKNDFESLLLELSKLENSNLKSKTENCIDCSKTSINIDRNNKSFKIIQKA
ncbi:hypothetical protein, partial [Flavobacterium sp.]|uniref:hypothetical protein n=1 Tax=Flavobacterium sp. TaxID=239 RepID=UPI0037538758